ncbi:MAG: Asp23/Gls24 family envelope stress response protein [Candidatus Omnitrophica bacterium]|nr:Asp23/Gls24 family envelope stress response protein [Candidatus Omnitrophota bacterium]
MGQNFSERSRTTDLGVVRINNDVIIAIASIAAMEVKGVVRMGGGIGKTLYDMVTKKSSVKGVRIHSSNGDAKLTVSIVVEYGVDIPRIADEVQDNVKRAVEKMTGLLLSEVDVLVEGVSLKSRTGEKKI